MKQFFLILLFFSVGIKAQIKKQKLRTMNEVENKLHFKSNKKGKYRTKSTKEEQVKRIINLSQQNDCPRKEIVKKNNDDRGTIIYEETSFIRNKMYLFIGLDSNKNIYPRDNRLVLREI